MSRFWTGETPESRCPGCHKRLGAATNNMDGTGPSVGDVTVCLYCGCFAVFTEHLQLRPPTAEELTEFTDDENVRRAQRLRRLCL